MGQDRLSLIKAAASVALALLTVAALLAMPAVRLATAWSGDPALNTVICAAAGDQDCPVAVPDGSGGAIIAWQDHRGGADWDIYVQRADSGGAVQWAANGVAVSAAVSDQTLPAAVSDGRGGAIVAWQDRRGPDWDIYAQRIDAAGAPLWKISGVAICSASGDQLSPVVVTDGAGGVIVAWEDRRGGDGSDIYAQRIGASGTAGWAADGSAVCTAASDQTAISAVGDTAGGAIIAWQDIRGGTYDVFAQRVDSSSAHLWTENGTAICTAAGHQISPVMVPDGSGGATIAWPDGRTETSYDVYGQRVDPAGAAQWMPNGVPVCTAAGDQTSLTAASDGAGGLIVAWQDTRSGTGYDIYGQRLDPDGDWEWAAAGAPLCTAPENQRSPSAVGGPSNGAIVVWQDRRSGTDYSIYGQSVDEAGRITWAADGVPLCTAAGDQESLCAAADGGGSAIVVWKDARGPTEDIYIQRVQDTGVLGLPPGQPVNMLPAEREVGVSLTPTLTCSAFSPGQTGDTHLASQWRMTTIAGDYNRPVFDSGRDGLALLQRGLESAALNGNTTYYWQIRHQSGNGLWSAWSAETSFTTLNQPPDRPAGVSPAGGVSGSGLVTALQSSAFHDPDAGEKHAASQWRITTRPGDYSSPVFLSPELTSSLTQLSLDGIPLTGNTAYYWQVRYQDSHGSWSEWSEERSFTTLNRAPGRPAAADPSTGARGVRPSPLLESSAFSDPDGGDTHAASQWQVSREPGDYTSPVFDNARLAGSPLTSVIVSPGLDPDTTYYWRVRYQDSHGAWSEWSAESSFTTGAEGQAGGTGGMTAASWVYIAGIALAAILAVAAVLRLNARSSPPPNQ